MSLTAYLTALASPARSVLLPGASRLALFRALSIKKAALLLGGLLGIGVAIFLTPQSPEPNPAPSPLPDDEVAWVRGLAFAGDSLIVATGGGPVHQDEMSRLRLWDADSGQQRSVLAGHAGGIVAVACTRDGQRVASTGFDRTLRIWDVATGRQQAVLQRPKTLVLHPLAFDAAGRLAWIEDGLVQYWDPVTGSTCAGPRLSVGEAVSMAFSPNGRLLATGGTASTDFATRLWQLPTGTLRVALPQTPSPVIRVSFAAFGRVLATGDMDGDVALWDSATGQRMRALAGLRTSIRALAFSADDSMLAAADIEDTVKVWEVASGREQKSFSTPRFFGVERRRENQTSGR